MNGDSAFVVAGDDAFVVAGIEALQPIVSEAGGRCRRMVDKRRAEEKLRQRDTVSANRRKGHVDYFKERVLHWRRKGRGFIFTP